MAQLVRDFDTMAERLEESVNAQARLLNDISHELGRRWPVSTWPRLWPTSVPGRKRTARWSASIWKPIG